MKISSRIVNNYIGTLKRFHLQQSNQNRIQWNSMESYTSKMKQRRGIYWNGIHPSNLTVAFECFEGEREGER